jgi:hypothetical protein
MTSATRGWIAPALSAPQRTGIEGPTHPTQRRLASMCEPRLLTSIVRGTPDDVCGAVPLLARGGLLLVQLLRGDISKSVHLAVCDPLAGTCSVLPPIKCKVDPGWPIQDERFCRQVGLDVRSAVQRRNTLDAGGLFAYKKRPMHAVRAREPRRFVPLFPPQANHCDCVKKKGRGNLFAPRPNAQTHPPLFF